MDTPTTDISRVEIEALLDKLRKDLVQLQTSAQITYGGIQALELILAIPTVSS